MEVINENAAFLSNFEVYELLKEGRQRKNQPKNVATISYEAIQYLEKMPCHHQNSEMVTEFLTALRPYKLTKAEKLQLLNLRPTSIVEIQLIIEELDERLQSEENIEGLIEVIRQKLPVEETESTQVEENES